MTRESISRAQERTFLSFIQNVVYYCKYYDGSFILFNTGLRVPALCGLTIGYIDFKKKRIRVDQQLQHPHSKEYIIEDTKTKNGERSDPMSPRVAACFRRIIENRKKPRKEPMVGGYTGCLFLDKNEMPMVDWEKYFEHIWKKHNRIYKVQLPKIIPYVCRHTFCSNMAKSGMNPQTLQYIMGHSDISITLDTYTHLKSENAQEEFDRVVEA